MSKQEIFGIMRNKFLILFILILSSFFLTACGAPSVPATTGTGSTTPGTTGTVSKFTIGGNVAGLDIGQSITLQNNSGDNLTVSANGLFTFATPLNDNSTYNISILTQPAGQICTVASGSGTINGSNITDVAVNCVVNPNKFTVSGTVAGMTQPTDSVVLKLTAGSNSESQTVNFSASNNSIVPFTFSKLLSNGTVYTVTIGSESPDLSCNVQNGNGTINGSNIVNVAVICSGAYNIAIDITDSYNNSTNNITIGSSSTVTATVKDRNGNPKQGAIVTFETDTTYAALATSTALTDASGNASVAISGTSEGATTITASTQINGVELQAVTAYSVGSPAITLGGLTFGTNPISAYGTTSISVEVDSNSSPVTTSIPVTFNSDCFTSGKAAIDTPVNTKDGIATTTYKDNGCGATDTITASALGKQSSDNLTVSAPSAGSIQFVSANPTHVTLKGTGGAGLQESSTVTFKVLDSSNNPLGNKKVNFSLSTTVGGITLSQASGTTDGQGEVSVAVNSGTVSTPVRVIATIDGTTIQTQSDQLTITTGIPDQDSASLSASILNIEGWSYDGETTVLTMRLADHFNNPVPDGTVVNFITEGGSITGSCTTTDGACSATLTSQNPRPADGRSTVLAYTIGNESFIDTNGNGWADSGEFTDTSEAFVDFNENGIRDSNEPYIDFNGNGSFDTGDGCYNGILRNPDTLSPCSNALKYIEVNDSIVIVFSGSKADIADSVGGSIDLNVCNQVKSITIRVRDVNKNIMPAGTTIKASTTDGALVGTTSYTVANTNAKNISIGVPIIGNPLTYLFQIEENFGATCSAGATSSGTLTITVTTPKGTITTYKINVATNIL